MNIRQRVLSQHLKEHLLKRFILESKAQLVSVYKQRVDMTQPACEWGSCWTGLEEEITYQDIEDLVEGS